MSPRRDKERWEKDITQRAKLLHRKITQANEIYKAEKGIPTVSEITQAFALSLLDISRYCSDNNINAREIDTVKLMAFSIPYLLSVRDYGLRLDIYSHVRTKDNNFMSSRSPAAGTISEFRSDLKYPAHRR